MQWKTAIMRLRIMPLGAWTHRRIWCSLCALLLTLPRQGYYPRPVGGVGGCGADLLPDELLALGRRAVCDVPGVLVLGVRTADGSAVFRLWVREEEREVTVAL